MPKSVEHRSPSRERQEAWAAEMAAGGEAVPAEASEFRGWVKRSAERELWFFSRWVLGNDHLGLGTFHRQVMCPFLTDFTRSRFKLLMVPMGHLKTTVASRSLPIHALIQPAGGNIYFKGLLGRDTRILLANETEDKAKENLQYIKGHFENNEWIRWLWPEVCWDNPRRESPRWSDQFLQVPRPHEFAEPSITAVGIKTGFIGRYYDIILPDDIAAHEASQNPSLMERVKKWRRSARTRLHRGSDGLVRGIYSGVGTHWGHDDVYVEWKKDPEVEVMIRSIIEERPDSKEIVPLWPEKFPLAEVEKLRAGTNPIEWALWYMNQPVPTGYTAMNWTQLREYQSAVTGDPEHPVEVLEFSDEPIDEIILQRHDRIANNLAFRVGQPLMDPAQARPRKIPRGKDDMDYRDLNDYMQRKYPEKIPKQEDTL